MSYLWRQRTFMTGNKMAEKIAPAVGPLDVWSFAGNFKSTVSNLVWPLISIMDQWRGMLCAYWPDRWIRPIKQISQHPETFVPLPSRWTRGLQPGNNEKTLKALQLGRRNTTDSGNIRMEQLHQRVTMWTTVTNDKRLESGNDRIMPSVAGLQGKIHYFY